MGRPKKHKINLTEDEIRTIKSLLLLEEKMKVILETPVSREAIRRALKNKLRPHKNDYWCILPKKNAEFVACMEGVLDVYELHIIRKDQ